VARARVKAKAKARVGGEQRGLGRANSNKLLKLSQAPNPEEAPAGAFHLVITGHNLPGQLPRTFRRPGLTPTRGSVVPFRGQLVCVQSVPGVRPRFGVEAKFLHDEPPAPFDHGEPSFSEEMNALVDLEVSSMKDKLAILEIPEEDAFLICKMFLVAKKGGGFRPVLNPRPLNRFTVQALQDGGSPSGL
jgi:hypothetical protein